MIDRSHSEGRISGERQPALAKSGKGTGPRDDAHSKWTHPSKEGHMNILVATDGSESAIDAARRAMDLLRPGAHVVLVAVIPEYEDPMSDAGA